MASSWELGVDSILSRYNFNPGLLVDNCEGLTCIVCEKLMIDACEAHCGCHYCHGCVVEYLCEGVRHCAGNRPGCGEEYLVMDVNVHRSTVLSERISEVRVNCPNESCIHICKLSVMEDHLRVCSMQDIDNRGDVKHTNQFLIELVQNLRNEVNSLEDSLQKSNLEIISLKEESRMNQTEIGDLKREIKLLKTSQRNVANISMVPVIPKPGVKIGMAIVLVDRFMTRKTYKDCVYSPYFYTTNKGYKVRLSIHPGGNGSGIDTHMSVFIHIGQGDYDDIIPWRCKHTFSVHIIHHRTALPYSPVSFTYDTAPDICTHTHSRSINKDIDGYGVSKYVSLIDLVSVDGLIVDDSLIVQCVVDTCMPM